MFSAIECTATVCEQHVSIYVDSWFLFVRFIFISLIFWLGYQYKYIDSVLKRLRSDLRTYTSHTNTCIQEAQLSLKDRAAVVRLELGDNIYGHYRSVFDHCEVIGQQSNRILRKERKIRAISTRSRSFKVIEVGCQSKTVWDFLLVININWYPLVPFRSYHSLLFKFWTLSFFAPPPLEGIGITYDVHLGLIGNRVVDFPLVLTELFFARCYG